jgi:hypothetical protein
MPLSEGSNKPLQSLLRPVRGLVLGKRTTGGGVALPRDECSIEVIVILTYCSVFFA